jgi:Domain of unknown function (DUF397)
MTPNRANLTWRKSSFSANSCVEVARLPSGVAVRDSKDPDGPLLYYTGAEWKAFVLGARNGEFDL